MVYPKCSEMLTHSHTGLACTNDEYIHLLCSIVSHEHSLVVHDGPARGHRWSTHAHGDATEESLRGFGNLSDRAIEGSLIGGGW